MFTRPGIWVFQPTPLDWYQVLIRNFVPAYVTRLETTTDVLKNQLAVNVARRHFQRIGQLVEMKRKYRLLGVEKLDMTDDIYI